MKNEKIFSKNGLYAYVLKTNILLHKQVAWQGSKFLSAWAKAFPDNRVMRVLDLACGGYPVAISQMIATVPQKFDYTGIDINPDQIAEARQFVFPQNVIATKLIEGNAWDFSDLDLLEQFDFVFSGMNLHHGDPQEIYSLCLQIKEKMNEDSLFISHDFYRPSHLPYLRRPHVNAKNPAESLAMISPSSRRGQAMEMRFDEADPEIESDWRLPFFERYGAVLKERGVPQSFIDDGRAHMALRDYPISVPELTKIAEMAGFYVQVLDLNGKDEPLAEYYALLALTKIRQH